MGTRRISQKTNAPQAKHAKTAAQKRASRLSDEEQKRVCTDCKQLVEDWNEQCHGCGFRLVLEPEEKARARYLRGPSLGAMFWTQGWAFGARLYLFFVLSLVPVVGLVVLPILLLFGRRLAWKFGGWSDWQEFKSRMLLMDVLGTVWILGLVAGYFWIRYGQGI